MIASSYVGWTVAGWSPGVAWMPSRIRFHWTTGSPVPIVLGVWLGPAITAAVLDVGSAMDHTDKPKIAASRMASLFMCCLLWLWEVGAGPACPAEIGTSLHSTTVHRRFRQGESDRLSAERRARWPRGRR